jgi:hypothetical protein
MAIAFVKSAKGTSASATVSWGFGSATTSGNLIVGAFAADDYNGSPDSGWTQSTGMEQQTFHGGYVWWRISTGETSPQAYTIGSATNSAWMLAEFSGVDGTPYDVSNGQSEGNGGSQYTTPAITPTTGGRVLVAMIGGSLTDDLSVQSVGTWINSFTSIDSSGSNGTGTNDIVGLAYRLVTGDGSTTYSSGADYSTGVQSHSGLIISFKEGAATGAVKRLSLLGVG